MEIITVRMLRDFCEQAIKAGCGDKGILVTSDDEGNSYHGLWYQFCIDPEQIRKCKEIFDDDFDPDEVVLLG